MVSYGLIGARSSMDRALVFGTSNVGSIPAGRKKPFFIQKNKYAPIAQLAEQSPLKRTVEGSNPSGRILVIGKTDKK